MRIKKKTAAESSRAGIGNTQRCQRLSKDNMCVIRLESGISFWITQQIYGIIL